MKTSNSYNFTYLILIGILSLVVPAVIAVLFYLPQTGKMGHFDVSTLPHFNAILNSSVAIVLIIGYVFIKQGKRKEHRASMISAFILSSLFLISYLVYHYQGTHTLFGDLNSDGVLSDIEKESIGGGRTIYLVVLLTHILLAAIIVPFVLLSVYFGITKQYSSHRKVSKWTFPLWLYVSISGVIVYLLISPYYH